MPEPENGKLKTGTRNQVSTTVLRSSTGNHLEDLARAVENCLVHRADCLSERADRLVQRADCLSKRADCLVQRADCLSKRADCLVRRQVSTIVLRSSTGNHLEDLARAVENGVNIYKQVFFTSLLSLQVLENP